MATAPSPNDLTRQQLDELDALLQRMLSLPITPPDSPGSAQPIPTPVSVSTPAPVATLSAYAPPLPPPLPATPVLLPLPTPVAPPVIRRPDPPVPAPQLYTAPVAEPPAPLVRKPTPPAPVPVPSPRVEKPKPAPPAPMPAPVADPARPIPASNPFAFSPEPEPEPRSEPTPTHAPPPVTGPTLAPALAVALAHHEPALLPTASEYHPPPLLVPFVAFNDALNRLLGALGLPGRFLRSGFVKTLFGLTGIGLIAYTAAKVAQLNGLLSLPVELPWPR